MEWNMGCGRGRSGGGGGGGGNINIFSTNLHYLHKSACWPQPQGGPDSPGQLRRWSLVTLHNSDSTFYGYSRFNNDHGHNIAENGWHSRRMSAIISGVNAINVHWLYLQLETRKTNRYEIQTKLLYNVQILRLAKRLKHYNTLQTYVKPVLDTTCILTTE